MMRRGALGRFGERPVVEPNDGIPMAVGARRDRQGGAILVADHQRTGGVEADCRDIRRLGVGGTHRGTHGSGDGLPDLGRIVLGLEG